MTTNKILNQVMLVSPPTEPEHLAHKQYVDGQVAAVREGLGAMSAADDADANGRPHVRQDGGWQVLDASGTGAIVGEIRLLPFRSSDLPTGWYFCNGDRFSLDTLQGEALNALPTAMKTDWSIAVQSGSINLPNLFSGTDGYFLRPVDNTTRVPGNRQADAIRNITGSFSVSSTLGLTLNGAASGTSTFSGPFTSTAYTKSYSFNGYALGYNTVGDVSFNAARTVSTAHENRPINIGMTPAIYLGV